MIERMLAEDEILQIFEDENVKGVSHKSTFKKLVKLWHTDNVSDKGKHEIVSHNLNLLLSVYKTMQNETTSFFGSSVFSFRGGKN